MPGTGGRPGFLPAFGMTIVARRFSKVIPNAGRNPERSCRYPRPIPANRRYPVANAWTEEIVWTTTADGARHDGVVIRPTATPRPVVVVWIHGFTGRFSEPHSAR